MKENIYNLFIKEIKNKKRQIDAVKYKINGLQKEVDWYRSRNIQELEDAVVVYNEKWVTECGKEKTYNLSIKEYEVRVASAEQIMNETPLWKRYFSSEFK